AVRGAVPADAADAQAVLSALAALLERRSAAAWEAVELVDAGRTQAQAAAELGVTRQAVGQRLAAAAWELERELRPTAARLLERAAVAGTLLAGWPEGLAVLVAVKGLGRYAELKAPAAAERFIIGTLASTLWAVGCVGCVVLLRR